MWQQSEYHKFARKLAYFISVIIDMRGGWGCVWNTHTCPLQVSLKPVEACSVNRFSKKPWHDLLSPRQFASCQIVVVHAHAAKNSDRISELVRLRGVLNDLANTWSDEFKTVLHHLSQNVRACHNSSWFPVWQKTQFSVLRICLCWSLLRKKSFLWSGNWGIEGLGGVKGFRLWPNLPPIWRRVKKRWDQVVAGG